MRKFFIFFIQITCSTLKANLLNKFTYQTKCKYTYFKIKRHANILLVSKQLCMHAHTNEHNINNFISFDFIEKKKKETLKTIASTCNTLK